MKARKYSAAPESATELLEAEEGLDSLTQSGLDTSGGGSHRDDIA